MQKFIFYIAKLLCFLVFRLCFRIEVYGVDNIPRSGPFIVAANHCSFLDPPVIGHISKRPLHYFANAGILQIPLLGRAVKILGGMPVYKDELSSISLRKGLRALIRGGGVVIFPEGTRSKVGERLPAKAGLGFLHAKSGAPVIPVRIVGTDKAWPAGAGFIRPCKIRVHVGRPFNMSGSNYSAIGEAVLGIIRDASRPQ